MLRIVYHTNLCYCTSGPWKNWVLQCHRNRSAHRRVGRGNEFKGTLEFSHSMRTKRGKQLTHHLVLAERIALVVFSLVVLMHSARAFLPSMERSSRPSLCSSALRMRAKLLLCSSRETRILVFGFCSEGRLQRRRGRWF